MASPQRSARKPDVTGKLRSELPYGVNRRWHCDW